MSWPGWSGIRSGGEGLSQVRVQAPQSTRGRVGGALGGRAEVMGHSRIFRP